MSDPPVFPWSNSKPISSSNTLKISSSPRKKSLNVLHQCQHIRSRLMKKRDKCTRSFTCLHTSQESSSMRLVIVWFDKVTSFTFFSILLSPTNYANFCRQGLTISLQSEKGLCFLATRGQFCRILRALLNYHSFFLQRKICLLVIYSFRKSEPKYKLLIFFYFSWLFLIVSAKITTSIIRESAFTNYAHWCS